MKTIQALVLIVSTFALVGCSIKTKEDVLIDAIRKGDAVSADEQLKKGADPLKADKTGIIPIQIALLEVMGTEVDKDFLKKGKTYSDPKMKILRSVLRKARATTASEIDETGPVFVTLQEEGDMLEGGSFVIYVMLQTSAGEKLQLVLSTYETEYVNVPSDRPFISIGKKYRIIGSRKDGIVEVYRIELLQEADNRNAMDVPTYYYLPSTYDYMKKYTWYGSIQ
jgi:hypothetical protein